MKGVTLSFKISRRDVKKYNVLYCVSCFQAVLKKVSDVQSKQFQEIEVALSEYKEEKKQ
jgi:hypothetical protein